MIFIAHRGNLYGKDETNENKPEYIEYALNKGFNVEVDVWYIDYKYYLGHDYPIYNISFSFLEKKNLWCHSKNIDALYYMSNNKNINCFYHNVDDVTLTTFGYLWTYPGKKITNRSIAVIDCLDKYYDNESLLSCYGICADNIEILEKLCH